MTTSTSRVRVRPARRANGALLAHLRRGAIALLFGAPGAALLLLMSVYPMVVLVQMSLSDVTLSDILTSWPWNAFANFRYIFDSSTFQEVAAQTVIFVVVVLVATMLAGFIVALVLRSPRGFSLVTSTTLVLVWVMPPVIVGSLWRFLLSSNGAVNSLLLALRIEREPTAFLALPGTALGAIAAVTVWVGIPFASLVIKSAILDVSEEVLDAARVDGANSWETLTRIVIPMIRSTLLILAVLTVVGAFKAFDLIYTMTKGGPGTKSATIPFLGYVTAFQSYQFGNAAAMSAVAMAFILILAVLYIVVTRKEEKG